MLSRTADDGENPMEQPRPEPWPQQPHPQPAPGYYGPPQPHGYPPQYQQPYPPATQVVVNVNGGGGESGISHLSGMTTGAHIVHGIITVCTFGLWGPVWWMKWRLGRRAIR
jgi:hypothetical protein